MRVPRTSNRRQVLDWGVSVCDQSPVEPRLVRGLSIFPTAICAAVVRPLGAGLPVVASQHQAARQAHACHDLPPTARHHRSAHPLHRSPQEAAMPQHRPVRPCNPATFSGPPAQRTLTAVTLAALSLGAPAQTVPAGQLQTITVTAERRIENIREVPSAVSSLQGEVLDVLNTSGQDVRLLSGRVPSLNIESSFGRAFPRFYIRGYGNTDFRLERVAAGVAGVRRRGAGEPHPEGLPAVRPGPRGSAARPAGHACSAATRPPASSSSTR